MRRCTGSGHRRARPALSLLVPLAALVPVLAPGQPASALVSYGVTVTPSTTPAFIPPACGTGTPAYNFAGSGDAADPQVVASGGTYYAFTTGNALGNHIAALVSSSPNSGYGALHGQLLWALRPCRTPRPGSSPTPKPLPASSTTPGTGSCSTTRPRRATPRTAASTAWPWPPHRPSRRPTCSSATWPTRPSCASPSDPSTREPFVDPVLGAGLPRLEAERRRLVGSGLHLVAAAQLAGNGIRPGLLGRRAPHDQQHRGVPLGDHGRGPLHGRRGRRVLPRLLGRRVPERGILRGNLGVQRAPRAVRAAVQILAPYGSVLGPGGGALFPDAERGGGSTTRPGRADRPDAPTTAAAPPASSSSLRSRCPTSTGRSPAAPRLRPVGYDMAASDGGVFNFGNLPFCGSEGGRPLNRPVVGMAATRDGGGYWLVASDGGIFTYGDAGFYGSAATLPLSRPVVGHGGDCRQRRLLAGGQRRRHLHLRRRALLRLRRRLPLNQPIVGHGPHARRRWLLAGGQRWRHLHLRRRPFLGSTGSSTSTSPWWAWPPRPTAAATGWWPATAASSPTATHTSTARPGPSASTNRWWAWPPTPDGDGYWLVASDGGIFTYGDAAFYGSTGSHRAQQAGRGDVGRADRPAAMRGCLSAPARGPASRSEISSATRGGALPPASTRRPHRPGTSTMPKLKAVCKPSRKASAMRLGKNRSPVTVARWAGVSWAARADRAGGWPGCSRRRRRRGSRPAGDGDGDRGGDRHAVGGEARSPATRAVVWANPRMMRVKKIPMESTWAEFWKVVFIPDPAPRS